MSQVSALGRPGSGYGDIDQLSVNAIRMLAADMVEQANSGHPGMPMGSAPMAYVLWTRFLRHCPADPKWFDRDRFVLSAGHGSALQYALLHLSGYDLPLEQLKNFRQWGSATPGHPEHGVTPGVECTTGPLGQGISMAVGMALAEKYLADQANRPGHTVIDHHTYVICGDGDLMEGVSSEAASLAGALGLGKLIVLYDDNHISIEGSTDLAFTEDPVARFAAYGWHTQRVADGNDLLDIEQAIMAAKDESDRPSLIAVRTEIGFGSPKQGTASVHGEPLGGEARQKARQFFNWPDQDFFVPAEAAAHMGQAVARGQELKAAWQQALDALAEAHPQAARELTQQMAGGLPADWERGLPVFDAQQKPMATRSAGGEVINHLAPVITNLVGGSADLAPSTKTLIKNSGDMRPQNHPLGRNIHFGVREHAMGAIVNGMSLHGGLIPFGATFFVFSDYMRPALRMAAIQECQSIFVFTHDSIGVGEDGPTHQPVEHLMSLRAMPNMTVIRPADANETSAAWACALTNQTGPTLLVLTRQNLPVLDPVDGHIMSGVCKGGYVLADCPGQPQVILMATGSEVSLIMEAQQVLAQEGIAARVVSLPCWEIFAAQSQEYRDSVLPPAVTARVSVEAGATLGWERWVGSAGKAVGIDRFGASAPAGQVFQHLGVTTERVVAEAKALLA